MFIVRPLKKMRLIYNQVRDSMLQVTENPLQTDLNNKGDVSSHLNGKSSRTPCLLLFLPAVKDNSFIPTWSSLGPERLTNHNPWGENVLLPSTPCKSPEFTWTMPAQGRFATEKH